MAAVEALPLPDVAEVRDPRLSSTGFLLYDGGLSAGSERAPRLKGLLPVVGARWADSLHQCAGMDVQHRSRAPGTLFRDVV